MIFQNIIFQLPEELERPPVIVGARPPSELIKITELSIKAWKNYGLAVEDYSQGKITLEKRNQMFRVALRIDSTCNRLSAEWHREFTLILFPNKDKAEPFPDFMRLGVNHE